jgi:hypothetical protein
MRWPRRSHVPVLVALAAVVAAAVWWVRGAAAERREAQERWDAREPTAYSYTYGYCGGMCASCPVQVTVRDGKVTDTAVDEHQCGAPDPGHTTTIEDLFAIADDREPWPWPFPSRTTISYDERWGFPASIHFTCGPDTTDCGGGWSVSDFTVLR